MTPNFRMGGLRASLLRAASLTAMTAGLAVTIAGSNAASALVTQETAPPDTVVDVENTSPYWVGLGIRNATGDGGGTCTGLLINPRTVLFAAHCVFRLAPGAYGAEGSLASVSYTTDPTFGIANLRNWLFSPVFGEQPGFDGRLVTAESTNVMWHPSAAGGPDQGATDGTFLPADIAIAAFDTPSDILGRDGANGIGLLFSPITGEVAVKIGGFGQSGNALTGARQSDFQRRLGSNILSFLGSERDISVGVYPADVAGLFNPDSLTYQDLYWLDFDDPLRADRPIDTFNGTNPFDFDVFSGDAVDGEAITAAGDSGSPLVTSAFGRDVSLGVLSQGSRFFFDIDDFDDNFVWIPSFSNYGTAAGYNPLFLFWDFIVANNPYKYVAAKAGDGEWTDPNHWVQEIDPLYFTLNGGALVNALPTAPALGVSDETPNFGTITPNPDPILPCAFFGDCVTANSGSVPAGSASMPGSVAAPGVLAGTPVNQAQAAIPGSTGVWPSFPAFNSGPLTGPGSTGFVPNNTDGTPGVMNSANYFEINLRAAGTTFLTDATITIDRLNVRGVNSGLTIRSGARLNTLLTSYLDTGTITVNGVFAAPALGQSGGLLTGTGQIVTPQGLSVVGGVVSGGSANGGIGTLSVTGNTSFGLGSLYGVDISSTASDRLAVTGGLAIGAGSGFAASFATGYAPAFGSSWTVASASSGVTGQFSTLASNLTGVLRPRLTYGANNIVLDIFAVPFATAATYGSAEQAVIARGLDLIRSSGGYAGLSGLYASLDPAPVASLPGTFQTLTPLNGFAAAGLSETASLLITDAITGRQDQLAGGGRGFEMAGLDMLGINPQLASADPYDAMMMGAAAVVAAQEAAAEAGAVKLSLKEGWGGFLDISGLLGSEYTTTDFAGEGDLQGTQGTLGLDYSFADQAYVGVALSYFDGDVDMLGGLQTADGDSIAANLYGGVRQGQSFLNAYLGYGAQSYDLERIAILLNGNQTLKASPDGETWLAGVKVGHDFDIGNGTITPHAGLDASWISLDAYRETGGSAAMSVAERESTVIDGRLGVTYSGLFDVGGGVLRPIVSAAYVIDVQSDNNTLFAAFSGYPPLPLSFAGSERSDGWAEYEVGLAYEGAGFGAALSYTGADNGQLTYGALSGRVSVAW
jgi:uncharacterized protein with beta-barrel porin domain